MNKEDAEDQLIKSFTRDITDLLEHIALQEQWERHEPYMVRVNGSYMGAKEMLESIRNGKKNSMDCLRAGYTIYIARLRASENPFAMTSEYIHYKKKKRR
jgi:hypothetical protein